MINRRETSIPTICKKGEQGSLRFLIRGILLKELFNAEWKVSEAVERSALDLVAIFLMPSFPCNGQSSITQK